MARTALVCGTLAALACAAMNQASAEEGKSALNLLKTITDHVSKQTSLAVRYDSEIEVVTDSLQKIQFNASGEFKLARPDRFRLSRTGGYADNDNPLAAQFYGLEGMSVTPDGSMLYVADGTRGEATPPYNRVRQIKLQ